MAIWMYLVLAVAVLGVINTLVVIWRERVASESDELTTRLNSR
jgi:hypothetical protein